MFVNYYDVNSDDNMNVNKVTSFFTCIRVFSSTRLYSSEKKRDTNMTKQQTYELHTSYYKKLNRSYMVSEEAQTESHTEVRISRRGHMI